MHTHCFYRKASRLCRAEIHRDLGDLLRHQAKTLLFPFFAPDYTRMSPAVYRAQVLCNLFHRQVPRIYTPTPYINVEKIKPYLFFIRQS